MNAYSLDSGLSHLSLHNFRNYENLDLAIEGNPVILTGPNGAGKTNILEAISFLSPGRGLRGIKLSQASRLPSPGNHEKNQQEPPEPSPHNTWAVSATLKTFAGPVQLGTALDYTPAGNERRLVKIDSTFAKSQAALTGYVNIIWVTPLMDRLFLDAASLRRKFIDRMVYAFDPTHGERLHRYEHRLRERSQVLRQGGYDPLWVSTLERDLAEDGVAITAARFQGARNLETAQSREHLSPFPRFQATMTGEVESWLENQPALAAEDRYTLHLKACRLQDAETGGAGIGPHRSDFVVRHLAKQCPAELCSTGEQKMLLLAIILAFTKMQETYHSCPVVLLLDEVAAHLDKRHRHVLFDEICTIGRMPLQVWMTGTDLLPFRELESQANFQAQFLDVRDAAVTNSPLKP